MADHRDVDAAVIPETLGLQPEKRRKLSRRSEESGCSRKDEGIPEGVTLAKKTPQ